MPGPQMGQRTPDYRLHRGKNIVLNRVSEPARFGTAPAAVPVKNKTATVQDFLKKAGLSQRLHF